MKESDVRARAFAMPLTSPAFPPGPYRFRQREYLIIAYRTDPAKLRALVPEPLEVDEPVVKYEFIRMPDSTGFGEYTADGGRRQFRELTDEILASRSPRRNRCRRHCHSRSVLCLLGPDGSDRVDGDKLCALLVGSFRDP